jgi:hypothetical protein
MDNPDLTTRRRSSLVLVALAAAGGLAATGAPVSTAAGSKSTPVAKAAACYTATDGYSNSGTRVAGVPARWEYGTSPYIGARYNQCSDTLSVYYGGYTGIDYYNLRWNQDGAVGTPRNNQAELGPGLRRVARFGSDRVGGRLLLNVQACNRGGFLQSSSCTRWSPTLRFHTYISDGQ